MLTGAGISTESGIPDFRSPSGIWARYDAQEYATIDAFLGNPNKVWEFYGMRLLMLDEAQPNDGHRALAELEDRGWVSAVITQNIDRLHEQRGIARARRGARVDSHRRAVSTAEPSCHLRRSSRCCPFRRVRLAAGS